MPFSKKEHVIVDPKQALKNKMLQYIADRKQQVRKIPICVAQVAQYGNQCQVTRCWLQ